MGKERGKTGLKRGKKRVGTGAKTGLERYKKRNLAKFENLEWRRTTVLRPFFTVPHLSSRFLAVPPFFSPVFHGFGQKGEKDGCPKTEERERKERIPFPFLSRSHFFPFLSWHISSTRVTEHNYHSNNLTEAEITTFYLCSPITESKFSEHYS